MASKRGDPEAGASPTWREVISSSAVRREPPAIQSDDSGKYRRRKSLPPPPDEDDAILTVTHARTFKSDTLREALYWIGTVLSLGALHVCCQWFPKLHASLRLVREPDARRADYVLVRGLDRLWALVEVFAVSASDSGDGTHVWTHNKALPSPVKGWWSEAADEGEATPLVGGKGKDKACVRVFEWRQERFWLDPDTHNTWYRLAYNSKVSCAELHGVAVAGLDLGHDNNEQARRVRAFGRNRIRVPRDSFLELLVTEMATPFFLFQVFSVAIWFAEEYWTYTAILLFLTFSAIVASAMDTQRNQATLERIATYESQVRVLRRSSAGGGVSVHTVTSARLLPGDVVQVSAGMVCPSDLLLLTGSVVVNEAMLTGESAPVPKEPIPVRVDQTLTQQQQGKHVLLCGTKVVQAKAPSTAPFEASRPGAPPSLWTVAPDAALHRPQHAGEDGGVCLALVLHTSFSTEKGKLVRGILFPQVKSRAAAKRERDVIIYVAVLSAIMAVCVAWYAVYGTASGVSRFYVVTRCLDVITILVPPALPLALTIGIGFAAKSLAKKQIYSTSPAHIASAGQVDTVCYDKTGTLTKEEDRVWGVCLPSSSPSGSPIFPDACVTDVTDMTSLVPPEVAADVVHTSQAALWVMSAAHSLGALQHGGAGAGAGEGDLVGDPLEIAMFRFSQATLSTRPGSTPAEQALWSDARVPAFADSLIIPISSEERPGALVPIRRAEFDADARMMSTLAVWVDPHGSSRLVLLSKGAPESIARACTQPQSSGSNLDQRLAALANAGKRVLALAYRLIEMPLEEAMAAPRGVLERELHMCGLLAVANDLKDDTRQTLAHIADAGLWQAMVTGDNALTALAVARECGPSAFVRPGLPALVIDKSPRTEGDVLCALEVESGRYLEDKDLTDWTRYNLVVTGAAFHEAMRWEADGWPDKRPLLLTKAEMLRYATVFARFNPKEKQQVVRGFQDMGRSVAMIGDGANDSYALKQADAGISIAAHMGALHGDGDDEVSADEKEAAVPSIAAHFSTPQDSIHTLAQLLCEGRGALASAMVTLRYMLDYGFIQCTAVMILYARNTDLTDMQFLWADFFNVLILLLLLDLTPASDILRPGIPESDLLKPAGFLGGTLVHVLVIVASQVIIHLVAISTWWYAAADDDTASSYDQTVAFYASSVQYVIAAAALSHTYGGFRANVFWSNPLLVAAIAVLLAVNASLFLSDVSLIEDTFGTVALPLSFRYVLLGYTVVVGLVLVLLEVAILRHAVPIR